MATNCWDRHGIRHLSASSLALYRNEPALWVLRYLHRIKDDAGPGAWRGSAVEGAVNKIIYEDCSDDDAIEAALGAFEISAQGDLSDDVQKERAVIPDMVRQASVSFRSLGKPVATQFKVEHWIDGIEIPVLGYIDYLYEDFLIDLKTTLRMPSEPRPDHAVQVVSYSDATSKRPGLIYVTPKKTQRFNHESIDAERARWTLRRSAHAIRAMLSMTDDRHHAATLFTPNFDSYMWNETTRTAALELWK